MRQGCFEGDAEDTWLSLTQIQIHQQQRVKFRHKVLQHSLMHSVPSVIDDDCFAFRNCSNVFKRILSSFALLEFAACCCSSRTVLTAYVRVTDPWSRHSYAFNFFGTRRALHRQVSRFSAQVAIDNLWCSMAKMSAQQMFQRLPDGSRFESLKKFKLLLQRLQPRDSGHRDQVDDA